MIQDIEFKNKIDQIISGSIESEGFSKSRMHRTKLTSLFFTSAPVIIAALADLSFFYNYQNEFPKRPNMYNEGYVEIQSVSAAIENILLTAHAIGYGTCWMRVFLGKNDLENLLSVKKPFELISFIALGIPDHSPTMRSRKALHEIVTFM